MSEATPEAAPAQEQPPAETVPPAEPAKVAEETDWKAEARKWEERAKENRKEVQRFEREKLPEAERAAAEAEERGRTAATQAFGQRLATSDIRAAAAEAGADLSGVFDYLDLSRFVGEDGEPDARAIKAFVGGLPSREAPPAPAFDGGSRTPPPAPQGMTGLIRKAAGRA